MFRRWKSAWIRFGSKARLARATTSDNRRPRGAGAAGQAREGVLLSSLLLLGFLFAFTDFLSRMYHDRQATLAREWSERGDASLSKGDVLKSLEEYRNALAYSPADSSIQFHLAQSLAAAGRDDEARAYFVNLLAKAPGDGQTNLKLARLAAREGSAPDAIRYYHAAIYGVWASDPLEARHRARVELCEFLLTRKENPEAEAEIMALGASVPEQDTPHEIEAGNLFLRVGDAPQALKEFRLALRNKPSELQALVGAGTAAFDVGDFRGAVDHLTRARRESKGDASIASLLENSRLILETDPFAGGLTQQERVRRTAGAFEEALAKMEECSARTGGPASGSVSGAEFFTLLDRARTAKRTWSEANLLRHTERVDEAMKLVFQMELAAELRCGEPQGADLALLTLAKHLPAQEK